jgi:hypothetical protein
MKILFLKFDFVGVITAMYHLTWHPTHWNRTVLFGGNAIGVGQQWG